MILQFLLKRRGLGRIAAFSFSSTTASLDFEGNGASENAKLLVGLPGAPDAGDIDYYYVHPENVPSLISQSQGTDNFAGIMIYDAGASDEIDYNGNNYAQVVKNALNNA